MNLTSLQYTGNVKIDLTIKDKTFTIEEHNAGTHYLMKVFAQILTKEISQIEVCVPQFIDIEFVDTAAFPSGHLIQDSDWTSYLKQLIELNSKQTYPPIDTSAIEPYAEFTALLVSSNLSEIVTEVSETKQYRIALKSGYDETTKDYHTLATLPISAETLMKVTPGTQATITWIMKVSNKTE